MQSSLTAKGKRTSVSTAAKGRVVAASTKSSKARVRRAQEESTDDDHDDEVQIGFAEEIEDMDKHTESTHESQEAPELVESNYLETQQKDE